MFLSAYFVLIVQNMSAVEEIINYKRSPDEDFYAILNCDESSSVSKVCSFILFNSSHLSLHLMVLKQEFHWPLFSSHLKSCINVFNDFDSKFNQGKQLICDKLIISLFVIRLSWNDIQKKNIISWKTFYIRSKLSL